MRGEADSAGAGVHHYLLAEQCRLDLLRAVAFECHDAAPLLRLPWREGSDSGFFAWPSVGKSSSPIRTLSLPAAGSRRMHETSVVSATETEGARATESAGVPRS